MLRFLQTLGIALLLDEDPNAGGGGGEGAAPAAPADPEGAGGEAPKEDPAAAAEQRPFEKKMRELREQLEQEQKDQAAAIAAEAGIDPNAGEEDLEAGGEEGAEGAGEEATTEGAGEDGGDVGDEDFVVVALPARRQGDPDFELPIDRAVLEELGLDEKDVVERVNQLKNGALYRAEFEAAKADIDSQQQELDGIYEALADDPVAFMAENVDGGLRAQVAEALLLELDDEAFDAVVRKIDGWARDPGQRETTRTKEENRRLKAVQTRQTTSSTAAAQKKLEGDLRTAIRSVLPDGLDPRRVRAYEREAATELKAYAKEHKLTTLDPAKVPEILLERAVHEVVGISLNGEKSSSAGGAPPKSSGKNGDGKKPSSAAAPKGKTPDVRERLRRRKSAATTPAGAGSAASAGFTKVSGEDYQTRRNRVAKWLGLKEKKVT